MQSCSVLLWLSVIERLIVCTPGPLPLKRTRARAQSHSAVSGCIWKAVYGQLECVHDMGLNEVGAAKGAESRESVRGVM